MALPAIGSYLCGQFAQGVPMNGLLTVLRAGDPGYVPAGLSNTSTSSDSFLSPLVLVSAVLTLLTFGAGFRARRRGGRLETIVSQ